MRQTLGTDLLPTRAAGVLDVHGAELVTTDDASGGRITQFASMDVTNRPEYRLQPKEWQRRGWDMYDQLGEVHYALTVGANIATRLGLTNEVRNSDGQWIIDGPNSPAAGSYEMVERCFTDLCRETWMAYQVGGEGYLGITTDNYGLTDLGLYSTLEMQQQSDGSWVHIMGDEIQQIPVAFEGTLIRAWRRHPKMRDSPDSALKSVLTECKELFLLKLSILARITSRLAMQGMLFLPQGLTMAGGPSTAGDRGQDQMMNQLKALFTATLQNPGSSAAAMPILLSGKPEDVQAIKHIVLDTTITDIEIRQRIELRDAIANGIELPQQSQTTTANEVHHWGMWAIDERALSGHVVPVIRGMTQILTERIMWPDLRSKNPKWSEQEVRRHRFGIDPTNAALNANKTDQAILAYQTGLIGAKVVRRLFGFTEADAMVGEELTRWLGLKLNSPEMAMWQGDTVPSTAEILKWNAPKPPGVGGFAAKEPAVNGSSGIGTPGKLDQS